MAITGRLTADAKVNTLQSDRQVVNFSVVYNDYYKTKEGERKQVPTFFDCSYWLSSKVAEKLTKGTIVLLYGRIGVNVWNNMQGEAKASLTFHVNNIKFIGGSSKMNGAVIENTQATAHTPEIVDDLPF